MNASTDALRVVPYVMVSDGPGFVEFLEKTFQAAAEKIIKSKNGQKIIHGELKIGESLLYFADGTEEDTCEPKEYAHQAKEPSNIHLFVYVNNVSNVMAKAEKAGGASVIPLMENENGQMGGFVDPFNNLWWIQSKA